MNTTQFETGAKTEEANNFLLSADCNRQFNEELKELSYKIWKVRNEKNKRKYVYFTIRLKDLIDRFNGKLENVEELNIYQISDVIDIYIQWAENSHENDLKG